MYHSSGTGTRPQLAPSASPATHLLLLLPLLLVEITRNTATRRQVWGCSQLHCGVPASLGRDSRLLRTKIFVSSAKMHQPVVAATARQILVRSPVRCGASASLGDGCEIGCKRIGCVNVSPMGRCPGALK